MTWTDVTSAWDAVWESTATGWKLLYDEAVRAYGAAIRKDPEQAARQVEAYLAELAAAREALDLMKARLPDPAVTAEDLAFVERYQALDARWHELAAGFYADTAPVEGAQVGIVPLFIVAGLAVGVGAASWSFAAYEYAVNLREETALAARELDARVDASKEGRALPPSTLPQPSEVAPVASPRTLGMLLLGGLALTAGALTLPILLKRS